MTALTVQQESLADARITRDSNACMAEIYADNPYGMEWIMHRLRDIHL